MKPGQIVITGASRGIGAAIATEIEKRGYPVTGLNKAFLARDSVKSFLAKRIPVGKPGTPEQVARLVGGILDENLTFLTGETIYIDGGQGMFH